MSLKESLMAEMTSVQHGCRVKIVKTILNDIESKLLDEALKDENVPTTSIARALKTEGYTISVHSIGRHRRGDCSCGTK